MPPVGTIAGELVRAAIVGAGFLLIFAIAEAWRKMASPPVEWTRKFVHFGGGIVAASFPWLFRWHWTVVALAGVFFLILWGSRRLALLESVHGVQRKSEGGLYYPIAVYLLFLIASDDPIFYVISLLVLVVSDTVAAILGSSYGRVNYTVETDRRTVEGSLIFFLSTFLVVHLPLLLLASTAPLLSVMAAFQIALLMTLFEGISLRGNDNLIVPLVTYFLLIKLTAHTPAFLAWQIGAQLLIMAILAIIAWRFQFLTASGAMAFMLFYYGAYGLGGRVWTIAPTLALVAYIVFYSVRQRLPGTVNPQYQVVAAFYVAIVPGMLYVANNIFETMVRLPDFITGKPLYVPYLGAVAAQLALIVYDTDQSRARTERKVLRFRVLAALMSLAVVVPIGLLVGREFDVRSLALAAFVVAMATLVNHLAQTTLKSVRLRDRNLRILRLQTASVLASVLLMILIEYSAG